MCVLFLLTCVRRSWVPVVEGTKYVYRQGLLRKGPVLTVVGVEPKARESPVGLFFIMDAT